ncbi:DgyrCDS10052 [Dimorphilus gyrociliatus]|uniref:DgyrCDS10052 n=1 Tax=Dimorphilus gyrociliatus TaxID=2664684 RepID=A0A7I8W129_9ANNE|nr:DgyrCDS10052 [Dimorphilus gyrociliatus]
MASHDTEWLSVELGNYYDIGKDIQDIVFHPTLNTILVINSDSTVQVLDAGSGLKLAESDLNANTENALRCAYLPKSDRLVFTNGNKLSCRSDFNGIILLPSSLQSGVCSLDETIKLELPLPEAYHLYKALCVGDLENVEHCKEITNCLQEAVVKARTESSNKNHKIAKWAVVCMEAPIGKLKTVCSQLVEELKRDRSKHNLPGLPVASSVVYRLQNLFENSTTADTRSLMCSEEARRNTFTSWPHMTYKWALPEAMAEAGFYHQPNSTGEDRALCFTCNVCLVYWEPCDEPWSEHERHSPNCPFVKGEYTNNVPLSVSNATERAMSSGEEEITVIGCSLGTDCFATGTSKGNITLWDNSINLKKYLEFAVNPCDPLILFELEELSSRKQSDYSRPLTDINLTALCVLRSKHNPQESCSVIGGVTVNLNKLPTNEVEDLNSVNKAITAENIINDEPSVQKESLSLLLVWSVTDSTSLALHKKNGKTMKNSESVKPPLPPAPEGGWEDDNYFEHVPDSPMKLMQDVFLTGPSLTDSENLPFLPQNPLHMEEPNDTYVNSEKGNPSAELIQCVRVNGEMTNVLSTIDGNFIIVAVKGEQTSKVFVYSILQMGINSKACCERDIDGIIKNLCLLRQQAIFSQDTDSVDEETESDPQEDENPPERKTACGMMAVTLVCGDLLILDLSNLNTLARIRDAKFVSTTYCSSLDKLCATTTDGKLNMYSLVMKKARRSAKHSSSELENGDLRLEDDERTTTTIDINPTTLKSLHSLLQMQTLKCHITAPQCWTEIQNESRRNMIQQQTHTFSRTWRLEQDSYSWDEHLFDISLHKPSSVAHVDLTLKLRNSSNHHSTVQVTLLKQFSVSSTLQRKSNHKAPVAGRSIANPVKDNEFLAEHNAQILVGPIELSQHVDANGKFAYITLSSPELTTSKSRNLLLHFKCTYIPCNALSEKTLLKRRKSNEYLLSSASSKNDVNAFGCDIISEIAISVRKYKKLDVKEKSERSLMLRNRCFLEKLVQYMCENDCSRLEREKLLCLDILQWNAGLHFYSKLENSVVLDVIVDKIDIILRSCLLNGSRLESDRVCKLLVLCFDKQRCKRHEPRLLKAILTMLSSIETIVSANALYSVFLLLDQVKMADVATAGEQCIQVLNRIAKLYTERDSEMYALLRSKFDLYGRPFDPLIFHFQLNQSKVWSKSVPVTYSSAVSQTTSSTAANITNSTAESGEKAQQVYDWHSEFQGYSSYDKKKRVFSPFGLLEVEPLHLTTHSASEGMRMEGADYTPSVAPDPVVSGWTSYGTKGGAESKLPLAGIFVSHSKHLLSSMPATPKTTPQTVTPQGMTPSASPPDNFQYLSGAHSPFISKGAQSKSDQNQTSIPSPAIGGTLTLPPAQLLLVDGMHSGARRYITLDAGRSIMLTDIVIPTLPTNVASLAIDVWDESEESNSQRILFSTDVSQRPVHLSCLSPPPICRYIKLTATGGHGCCTTRTVLPLGHFFGYSIIENETVAMHRLNSLVSHYEDVHCKYSLACHKLSSNLHSLSGIDESEKDKKAVKILKDSYYTCLQLQLQLSFIHRSMNRFRRLLGQNCEEEEIPTDKLMVISECLLSTLLCLTVCSSGTADTNAIGNALTPSVCHNLLQSLCVKGTPKMQVLTGIFLVRVHGTQSWWGTFVGNSICDLFAYPNCNFIPKQRLLSLFTILGHKTICSASKARNYLESLLTLLSRFLMPLLEVLAQNGTDEDIALATSKLDLELLTWILLFLSKNLEVVSSQNEEKTNMRSRWCFLQSDVKAGHDSASGGPYSSSQCEKLYKRKLHKRLLHHKQQLLELQSVKLNKLQNLAANAIEAQQISKEAEKLAKKEQQIISKTLKQYESKTFKDALLARRKLDEQMRKRFPPESRSHASHMAINLSSVVDIEKEKCIPVVKGLVGLLLTIDVSSNVHLLLVLCKLIAKISHLPKPSINLSEALTPSQLKNLMLLQSECDSKHLSGPWTSHAVNSLLYDLVQQQSDSSSPINFTGEAAIPGVSGASGSNNSNNATASTSSGACGGATASAISNVNSSSNLNASGSGLSSFASSSSKVEQMDLSFSDEDLPIAEQSSDKDGNPDSSSDDTVMNNLPDLSIVGAPITIISDPQVEHMNEPNNIFQSSVLDVLLNDHIKKSSNLSKHSNSSNNSNNSESTNISMAIDSRTQVGLQILADLKIRMTASNLQDSLHSSFVSTLPLSSNYGHSLHSCLKPSVEDERRQTEIVRILNMKSSTNEELIYTALDDLVYLFKEGKLNIDTLLNMWSSLASILNSPILRKNMPVVILMRIADNLLTILSSQHFLNVTTSVLALNILSKLCVSEIVATNLSSKDEIFRLLKSLLTDMNTELAGPGVCTALSKFLADLQKGKLCLEIMFKLATDICQVWPRGPIDLQHSFLTFLSKIVTGKNSKISQNLALQYVQCVSTLISIGINTGNVSCQTSIDSNRTSCLESIFQEDQKEEKIFVNRPTLLALVIRICAHLVPYVINNIEMNVQYKFLSALNDCSSNTLAMLMCAAGRPPPQIINRTPSNAYDEMFSFLLSIHKQETGREVGIQAIAKILADATKLSQAVLWLCLTVLDEKKKLAIFLRLGGVIAVCRQLINSSKFSLCSWPLVLTEMLEEDQLMTGPSTKLKEEEDGLKNLAPLCRITSSSKNNAEALLLSNPPHRRARSATWTYHFSPGEVWVDLTLHLPFAALLYQVNIVPHAISLSTSPYLVALETAMDSNNVLPLCEPLHTAGMSTIKLKLDSPTVVTSVTIRLHRPLDNSSIGLSQVLLLGTPAFLKIKSDITDGSNRKSGAAWLKLLHHCLISSSELSNDVISCVQAFSTENRNFVQSCTALTLNNSCGIYGDALEEVLVKLGSCEESLSKRVLECILNFTESTEMSVEIFKKLAARVDQFMSDRLTYILEWLSKTAANVVHNRVKPPANGHVQAIGNVLWNVADQVDRFSGLLNINLLQSLFEWAMKTHDSSTRCAIESVICSICMLIPSLLKPLTENLYNIDQQALSILASACSSKRAVVAMLEGNFLLSLVQKVRATFDSSSQFDSFPSHLHAPVLKFLARVSTVSHFQDFLGSLGQEFWNGLLLSVCTWKHMSDYVYRESVHTACIELVRAVTLCHRENQKLIASCLCHVLQTSPSVSAFLRRILLQVLLEYEKITINIHGNVPLTSSLGYPGLPAHPRHALGLKGRCLSAAVNCKLAQLISVDTSSSEVDDEFSQNSDDREDDRRRTINYFSSVHVTSACKRVKKASKNDSNSKQQALKKAFKSPIVLYFTHSALGDSVKISPQMKVGTLLELLKNHKRDENVLDLMAHDAKEGTDCKETLIESCDKLGSSSILHAFADSGGLALLADRLPLLHSVAQTASAAQPMISSSRPNMDDWITLESGDDFYDDLNFISQTMQINNVETTQKTSKSAAQAANASAFQPAPPHSLLIFGLCLRLPKYADVLLRSNKEKAVSLLRLALGVADDAAGVPIIGSEAAQGLAILPMVVLNDLLESTEEDGMKLRHNIADLGILHVLLAVLAILSHQNPFEPSISHPHSHLINVATQSAKMLTTTTNNKKVSASETAKKTTVGTAQGTAAGQQYWAKGTGFGTGSTASSWDAEQALLRQKAEEDHVSALFHAISSFFNNNDLRKDRNFTNDLFELFNSSCLVSASCSYLRNDSVLDMSRHVPLYKALLRLLRSISSVPTLVPLLTTSTSTSDASLNSLLTSMKNCVDTYSSRLATKVTAGIAEEKGELSQLIPDIQRTAKTVESATEVLQKDIQMTDVTDRLNCVSEEQSLEETYMQTMKSLQFDTYNMVVTERTGPPKFVVSHHYANSVKVAGEPTGQNAASRARRLAQEAVTLSTSLPLSASSSVFVRCDEERLDVMKVLITGPDGTPYANGCFEFDVYFPLDYPTAPPHVHLCTTGNRSVRFNPNLYNDGKVCLSVLNTWHGRPEEKWNASTSSLLQVLVSIQSLILVAEPYFNEPGYERSKGTVSGEASSREYDSNIRQATVRWAMLDMLQRPPAAFRSVIKKHFWLKRNQITKQLDDWLNETQGLSNDRRSTRAIAHSLASLKVHAAQVKEELRNMKCPDDDDGRMNNINKDSRKRRSLPGLIEFILALSMLAMGGSPVLISQFIYELTSEKYNFNDNGASACSNDTNSTTLQETVQTESSHFMMYINIATMAPSILMTIFLGAFSDINGRKISIVISISCAGLAFFAYDIFIFFRISRKYFVLPGLIQGLGGGWIALYMATFSYLSDTTSIETRSFRVTLMEAAAGVTVTLSQIIMGLAIKKLGYLYSFLIIQGILAISLIITVVFLEDVIRVTPNVKRGLFSYIKATFHVYTKPSECGRRWRLLLILVILFMVAFVNLGRIDVITYLLKDSPFCWKSDYIGYYMGTSTCMTYTSSLIFTKLTGKIFGDKGLMMIGAISGIASNLLLGFAQSLSLLIAGELYMYFF